jgi:hypothetical protein
MATFLEDSLINCGMTSVGSGGHEGGFGDRDLKKDSSDQFRK